MRTGEESTPKCTIGYTSSKFTTSSRAASSLSFFSVHFGLSHAVHRGSVGFLEEDDSSNFNNPMEFGKFLLYPWQGYLLLKDRGVLQRFLIKNDGYDPFFYKKKR